MKMKNKTNQFLLTRRNNKGRRGYTLTEIALAVLILGIGLSGILSVFPVAIKWGGGAIASKTGSLAARITANHLDDLASGLEPRFYFWERNFFYDKRGNVDPGDFVFPTIPNGYYYECINTGTSDSNEANEPFPEEGEEINSLLTDNTVDWKSHRAMIRVPEYPEWQADTEYKAGDYVTPTMIKPGGTGDLDPEHIKALQKFRFRCISKPPPNEKWFSDDEDKEPDWYGLRGTIIIDNDIRWLSERYEGYYCTFFLRNSFPSLKHQWVADTDYQKDDYIIIPSLRLRAICMVAGQSDSSKPGWIAPADINYDPDDPYNQDKDKIKAGAEFEVVEDNDINWRCELIKPGDMWVADYKYFNDEDEVPDPSKLNDDNKPVDILSPLGSNYLYQCIADDGISDDNPDNEPEWYDFFAEGDTPPTDGTVEWECLGVNMVRPMVIQVHRQDPENDQYDEATDLLGVYEVNLYDHR